MSANATTAMHGQSSHVGLLGAAAVLTAVVAVGALGFVIGRSVATTTAVRPAPGPVVDNSSMTGPRTAAQKGLTVAPSTSGVDGRFAAQYDRYLAAQQAAARAAEQRAAIAATKDADASIVIPAALTAQYENWLKAQSLAAGSDFPDLFQRYMHNQGITYSGSDFAGQYANWLKVQAAEANADFPDYFQRVNTGTTYEVGAYAGTNFAAQYDQWLKQQAAAKNSDFPDWFQRVTVNTGTYGLDGYGGSDFAGQYEQWLKAQAAASASSFPDYFQRHEAPVAGGSGGRSVRLAQ
jgi:hypothetical protein